MQFRLSADNFRAEPALMFSGVRSSYQLQMLLHMYMSSCAKSRHFQIFSDCPCHLARLVYPPIIFMLELYS